MTRMGDTAPRTVMTGQNMRHQIIALTSLILVSSPLSLASAEESAATQARAEVTSLMNAWEKHRNQKIALLTIKGLDDAAPGTSEKTLLEMRLETLQRKKLSNREWSSYWEGEASLAAKLATQYKQLAPDTGQRPLKIESARLMKTADDLRASVTQDLTTTLNAARAQMKTNETALRSLLEQRTPQIEESRRKLDQLASRLDTLSARIRSANGQSDDGLQQELKALQAGHDALSQTTSTQTKAVDTIRAVLNGGDSADGTKDAAVIAGVSAYVSARRAVEAASKTVGATEKKANELTILAARMAAEDGLFRGRISGLERWAKVAQKKVENQKVYYDAIQSDIASINERLRSFKEPSKEKIVYADDVCGRPLTTDETPFAHHRACVAAISLEIDRLKTEREQSAQKRTLTEQLSASNDELSKAQVTDEQLVQDERNVSERERRRAEADPKEDSTWTAIWSTYAKRANGKTGSLSEAVLTSKKSRRLLSAKKGVLSDALKRLERQIHDMDARLKRTDTLGTAALSLLATSLQIIQVGWPALIYILFAWLLIRFIRRYRDKKEEKAVADQEGEGNEELAALTAQLEAARAEGDDSTQAALHEEMGQLQSRIKDENQRIATIARVAAQALSLIIYVATFLLVLDALTVDIGPILGGAAIFGLAISFGSQSLVKDVVSGFFILLENQYAVGDVVSINDQSGTVEKVTLRRTVLRDLRGGVHNITNGSISSVINSTQGWSRVLIHIGVAYGTNMDLVRDVINREGETMYADPEWSSKLTEKPTFVGVIAFGESEITVRVWFKTKTFQNWGAEREFNLRLKRAFEAAGIDIPFPQRTLHVVKDGEEPTVDL